MADQKASLFIGATVDKDAVVSGMQDAAAGVRLSADQMGVYFKDLQGRAEAAWAKISDDTRDGVASVNEETLKIAQSSKGLIDAQRELSAALSLARNKLVDQSVSMPLLAVAYENVRVKTLQLKDAQAASALAAKAAQTASEAAAKAAQEEAAAKSAQIEAATAARAAWQQELVMQDLRIQKERELARAQELSALKADILSRNGGGIRAMGQEMEALAVATEHTVPEMAAASGAIRVFEGALPIRAVERFLSTTLGLGPIIATMFPIIGAVALGEMLFEVGKKIYEVADAADKAGDAVKKDFAGVNDELNITNQELGVASDKLEDGIAKLEHQPAKGLQTGFDEATLAAVRLGKAIDADSDKVDELTKKDAVGFWGSLLSNKGQTDDTSAMLHKVKADIDAVRQSYDETVQQARNTGDKDNLAQAEEKRTEALIRAYAAGDAKLKAAQEAASKAQAYRDTPAATAGFEVTETGGGMKYHSGTDNSANLNMIAGAREMLLQEQNRIGAEMRKASDEQNKAVLEDAKGATGAANNAAEERIRAMETEYGQLQQMHRVTLKEEHDFWAARVGEFAKGSEQYKQLQDKLGQIDQQGAEKAHESLAKLMASEKRGSGADPSEVAAVAKAIEEVNRLAREQAEDVLQTGERWQSYNAAVARGTEIAAKLQESMEEGRLRILEQEHGISALGAAQAQARIHAEEHTRALKALRDELAALQAVEATLKPGDKGYEQNAAQQQNVQNQIAQQTGQGQVQQQQDQAAISAAVSKPYLTAFTDINNGWLKVQRDLIQGNRNISRDFAQMGLGLVQTMAQNFEKMLVQQLQTETRMVIAHHAANIQKTQSDATAATTGNSIHATAALKEVFIDAKTAAAGAWKATVGIPVIGPILAPIAAGASFAGVMALAAFEQGGVVGGGSSYQMGVPILAHAGERVLSYDQTQKFESMVNNSGSGETNHYHMGNHNYAQAGGDFKSQLAAHERHVVKFIKRLKREGKLG